MLDILLGDVFVRTPIIVTCKEIHFQMQTKNGGLGEEPLEKCLLPKPFRLQENAFSVSSSIPSLSEN